jgi:hypothetical protein
VAVDKTKLRLDIIHSFGADFEDLLEKARYEVARNEGAKVALKTAQAKVAEICAHVEKDQEEGILDALLKGDDAGVLNLEAYVKRKIMQAAGVVENLNGIVAINQMRSEGELTAYKAVFELTQQKFKAAQAKAELNAKIEAGDFEDDELMVLSPSEDIRARKVAAKAEKEGAAEEPSEDAAPTEEVAAEPEKPARKPRKKRSKSGKNTG